MGSPAALPHARAIAVDIDDTLNDFTATLRRIPFARPPGRGWSDETFQEYLASIRAGAPDPKDLLSSDYSLLRYDVHEACYRAAHVRPGAAELLRWMKSSGWRVVICTRRDLRRAGPCTKEWLGASGIAYDDLFSTTNKIAFCRAWQIPYLVDDDAESIEYGPRYGVRVFYPDWDGRGAVGAAAQRSAGHGAAAQAFTSFEELRRWIAG